MTKDYYTILGVAPTASSKEIESAYEELAAKHRFSSPQETAEVEEAYVILSNPEARSQYDYFYRFVVESMKNFDGIDAAKLSGKNFIPAISDQDLEGGGDFG